MRTQLPAWISAGVVFLLLTFIQIKLPDLLLANRLFPYGGWFQIILATIVAFWLYHKLTHPTRYPLYRKRMWFLFGCWFYLQFLLGLIVSDQFLLTGTPHFPIPFVILGGAIFRGELSFMPILFLVTILLSGAIWCSHLCYFGGFDLAVASEHRKSTSLPNLRKRWYIKIGILLLFILGAYLLRLNGASFGLIAKVIITLFLVEIGIITLISSRQGKMIHCTYFCPIGTIVSLLKGVNPIRIKINHRCTGCMRCNRTCRYDALTGEQIKKRKPALNCTGCGDCVSGCREGAIEYRFLNCSPDQSRQIALVTIVVLYILFFSVAMV